MANEREKDDRSRISFKITPSIDMQIIYGISACTLIIVPHGKIEKRYLPLP